MFTVCQLPELIGSEKQIAWANKLRSDAFLAVVMEAMSLEKQLKGTEKPQEQAVLARVIAAYTWFFVESHLTSKWWIDNRQGSHHGWTEIVHQALEARLNSDESVPYELYYIAGHGWKGSRRRVSHAVKQAQEEYNSVPEGHCPNCFNNSWDKRSTCKVCGYEPTTTMH